MHKLGVGVAGIVLLGLGACATPKNEYVIKDATEGAANSGIVVGRITSDGLWGTAISVKNLETGKTTLYRGATSFSLVLPEGKYQLSSVGSRRGLLAPIERGLTFTVKRDNVNYVGTIDYGCTSSVKNMTAYGLNYCGPIPSLGTCRVSRNTTMLLCMSDERATSISEFINKHPEYKNKPIQTSIMRPE